MLTTSKYGLRLLCYRQVSTYSTCCSSSESDNNDRFSFLFFSFLQPAPQPKAKKAEKKKRKRTKKGKNLEIQCICIAVKEYSVYHLENNQHWRPCAWCWLPTFCKKWFLRLLSFCRGTWFSAWLVCNQCALQQVHTFCIKLQVNEMNSLSTKCS